MSLSLATVGVICPGNSGLSLATGGVICITGIAEPVIIPDIYQLQLCEQLGINGIFTESAVYDPGTTDLEIYGIFDDNTFRNNRGHGHIEQKKDAIRFIVCEVDFDFDIYSDKQIYLSYRDETYTIQEIEYDIQGAQVLWLV